MPAAVVVALSVALAEAAEATLPAEASVSDGGGGERARGVWGKGGRALPAAVVGDGRGRRRGRQTGNGGGGGRGSSPPLRRHDPDILRSPPQDKATSDRLGFHQPLQL